MKTNEMEQFIEVLRLFRRLSPKQKRAALVMAKELAREDDRRSSA